MIALYVIRHGLAVPSGTPGIADDDRTLTPKGRRRVRQIARGLRVLGVEPGRIVTSPLPRARETACILCEVFGLGVDPEDAAVLRVGSPAAAIISWLRSRPEPRLTIVGHDPAVSDLVGKLVRGREVCELAKGGVAAFVGASFSELKLEWLATPRMLRRIRD